MTGNGTAAQPSPRSNRDCALDLISAGNTVESVASVFGMTVDGLRSLIEQPANTVSTDATPPGLAQPWHRFPGNAVYRCPNYLTAVVLVSMLIPLIAVAWKLFFLTRHPPLGVIALALPIIVLAVAIVRSLLSARVARFEMHSDAVALHAPAGCVVLPYADIVGLRRSPRKGGNDEIQFLTRRGAGLTIAPRRVHMRDRRLAAWLDSIPENGGDGTQPSADDATPWYAYVLPACQLILLIITLGISIKDTYMANMSMHWPTTEGIVTESVSLSGGGKGCRYPLHFHYLYTVGHTQYVGGNYRFGGVCGTDSSSVAAANPVGKHLLVHYRPAYPTESVIVPGGRSYTFDLIFLGALLVSLILFGRAKSR